MALPVIGKGLGLLNAVSKVSGAIAAAKEAADDFVAIKDFVLNYNSEIDQKFQEENPLPSPKEKDIKQILAYSTRSIALSVELIQETGEYATKRLAEKNT